MMNNNQHERNFDVACYYFPNYHLDARNQKVHGRGWSEWELVKNAKPRFPRHDQPKIPLWGFTDEADPDVMAKKIDAAVAHGIDAFIFDWYWYDDGPFLLRCLEEGFLGAQNNHKLKFAIMWANHDWYNIHPANASFVKDWHKNQMSLDKNLLYPGIVTPETFDYITDRIIDVYFSRDNYWLLEGCPYFSIYDLNKLIQSFGGIRNTRRYLEKFRHKTINAGFPNLNLNAVIFGNTILPGEVAVPVEEIIENLGFDTCTSYVWIHHVELEDFPTMDYRKVMAAYLDKWDQFSTSIQIPYYPNITMGWDSSPRMDLQDPHKNIGYPYMSIISGNAPQHFSEALLKAKQRVEEQHSKVLTINSWNEWTEGSYLEPDLQYGLDYLKAIQNSLGVRRIKTEQPLNSPIVRL